VFDARLERRQRAGQHAGSAAADQFVEREQRRQLVGGEPQARQFEALAFDLLVAECGVLAARAFDRRAQRIAQESNIAVQRGARAFQLVHQFGQRHRIMRRLQQAMQGEDAFVAVHGGLGGRGSVQDGVSSMGMPAGARKPAERLPNPHAQWLA